MRSKNQYERVLGAAGCSAVIAGAVSYSQSVLAPSFAVTTASTGSKAIYPQQPTFTTQRLSASGVRASSSTSVVYSNAAATVAAVTGLVYVSISARSSNRSRRRVRRSFHLSRRADDGKSMLADVKGPVNLIKDGEVEGLPWWWEAVWQLPFTARGEKGQPLVLGDTMHVFRTNIEQIFGGEESYDGAPLATGDLASAGLTDGTMYLGLQRYQEDFGDVYKLCFGPKSFMVVSDPQLIKHMLKDNVFNYDKGVLGEVLEDVMGKGLIPADFETWKVRRRAIVPGFHNKWLDFQVGEFARAGLFLVEKLKKAAASGETIDMEERFGSVALDIIGKAVFNYEFGSVEGESPVVKAAIQSLREVEHRAQTPFQYWKIPLMDVIVERQREFKDNMELLNGALNKCIEQALAGRSEADLEELEARDYSKMENPSLLRFLVDMKGEATSGKQLRDDMITMLIAGHETTASALTWALFELAQNQPLMQRVQEEVDQVMGDRDAPTYEDVKKMELVRLCIAESLRMYPEPPLLIRRAIDEDTLPAGATGKETKVLRAMDFFVSIYNLHRNEKYWPNANTFDPDRFKRKYVNPDVPGWAGYNPDKWKGQLYPNEIASDYALVPFGAGPRKCVGDTFAMLEASVSLAVVLRDFNFSFAAPTADPSQVGTSTGATIHTKNGLWMKPDLRKRT
eukprot:TRINITY_DN11058_c0_g1_i2.p1 TRINITY_DN11058_c0_g1~~TRINITY_DN11058_c0_g1_i2.p1  ORF type:complete len:681 (-),score=134.20 TRINITY_DN11058_c0_g1_i2:113-2155(-)